ncbi:hypothetical protein [uncultured Halopseudomonas sp.]|uniref:hypothetical protein n=1 Tax=uncultured Halopseudomonas sp. TaxID=2901193 RepID=UPI0030EDA692
MQVLARGFQSWGAPEPLVEFEAVANQTYFVRYTASASFIPSGAGGLIPLSSSTFMEVDNATGLQEIRALNLSD